MLREVGQLVHVLLLLAVAVGLVGLGQPVAGVLGFQGRELGGLGLRLQGGVVAAGLLQVGVGLVGAGGQQQRQAGEGGEGDEFTHGCRP